MLVIVIVIVYKHPLGSSVMVVR